MRIIGLAMIAIGFFVAAFVAVETAENSVYWPRYGIGLAVAVVGVALARAAARRASTDAATVAGDRRTLHDSLADVVADVRDIETTKETIDVYELHHRIDRRLPRDLSRFVDARKSLIPLYGLDAYADIMNSFAAGERYLNRVWSASVDGYIDEAHAYLTRALEQFREAESKLAIRESGARGG